MNMDLFRAFVLKTIGKPPDATRPVWLSGRDVVEALWPINERFRPNIHQIRTLPYRAADEAEADRAIEDFVFGRPGADWSRLGAGAWRVLLERQQQGIAVALASELAGNPLIPVPDGLPPSSRAAAAMLSMLHGMRLPFPAEDRSGFELPEGSLPESLRRH